MRVRIFFVSSILMYLLGAPNATSAQAPDTLFVNVDGHQMRLLVSGQGAPTIVLQAGSGGTARTWRTLQPSLAGLGRIVSYDRLGMGRSEPSSRPRTARVIAEELRSALRSAKLPPPFLLVGHSAGGMYARVFATMYPTEVVGLVLIDPASDEFEAKAKRDYPLVHARFDSLFKIELATFPPGEIAEENEWFSNLAIAQASDRQMTAPAIVLSAASRADMAEFGSLWTDEHRRWAASAPRREYVRVDSVGHGIHQERPAVVIDAIRRMLAEWTRSQRR